MVTHRFANESLGDSIEMADFYEDVRYLICSNLIDGAGTYELGGADYSSTSNVGKYTSSGNTVINYLTLRLDDTDVAQDTTNVYDLIDAEGMLLANTALTNGFLMGVKRADGTNLVDIASSSVPIVSLYQLYTLADYYYVNTATESATTTANMVSVAIGIDLQKKFGKGLLLRDGDYFHLTVRDQTTGLSIYAQVFGYQII